MKETVSTDCDTVLIDRCKIVDDDTQMNQSSIICQRISCKYGYRTHRCILSCEYCKGLLFFDPSYNLYNLRMNPQFY